MTTLVIVGAVIFLAGYLGLYKPVAALAAMANREISVLDLEHKVSCIGRVNKVAVDTKSVSKAKAVLTALESVDL